jgi:hypothetical protein
VAESNLIETTDDAYGLLGDVEIELAHAPGALPGSVRVVKFSSLQHHPNEILILNNIVRLIFSRKWTSAVPREVCPEASTK